MGPGKGPSRSNPRDRSRMGPNMDPIWKGPMTSCPLVITGAHPVTSPGYPKGHHRGIRVHVLTRCYQVFTGRHLLFRTLRFPPISSRFLAFREDIGCR